MTVDVQIVRLKMLCEYSLGVFFVFTYMRSAIEPKVIQVLRIVTGKLKGKNVSWVLIGSTS
ncbi:MAG: hypothetical protein OEZ40_10805, partial [Candidatus Bathyarchaeota archaeon]|nr:hypothetical protein [Candidatus Bathyarchaeota archaeon]